MVLAIRVSDLLAGVIPPEMLPAITGRLRLVGLRNHGSWSIRSGLLVAVELPACFRSRFLAANGFRFAVGLHQTAGLAMTNNPRSIC